MTLENCKRLLKHYEDTASGAKKPEFTLDHQGVMERAKINAEELKARISLKEKLPKYQETIMTPSKPKEKK